MFEDKTIQPLPAQSSRRSFLRSAGLSAVAPFVIGSSAQAERPAGNAVTMGKSDVTGIRVTGIDLHIVRVNERGDWYFIELKTNKGLVGLGECSHAFSKAVIGGETTVKDEVKAFFEFVKGESPFNIEQYRQRGFIRATDKLKQTVFSGIEQALWDLCGKSLGVPTYMLLGGKVHDQLNVYANINRATNERDANGRRAVASFQKNAEQALKNGFKAVKLAPFDEMKPLAQASAAQIQEDIDHAVKCVEGVRQTIGNDVLLLIDVHSHLNTELSQQTAKRIESSNLYWFEEPVDPQKFPTETKTINDSIQQTLAGGEAIFGRKGYAELIHNRALDIIMPDVKHCGGILELKYIAALAENAGGIKVAPHNPSGPLATAASVVACAGLSNFAILEYAFGEVPWSNDLVIPREQFNNGFLPVSDLPGNGISLNYDVLTKHK